ncbi:energy transducer TonB [Collimonas sp. NPDC087041]|uniref:energy transducer TonB n=1 Tax=Collimonas sp. NPDC087041 TaxID=3363960 RepID=UPI00380BAA63
MSIITLSHPNDIFVASLNPDRSWWNKPGALTSFGLHVAAIAAVWGLSQRVLPPEPKERAIELVLAPKQLQPPEPPPPPKIEPQKPQPKVSSARPLPAPVPRSTPVAAEKAEIAAPPAPPVVPTPSEPVKAAAPEAPPAPPKPRVISNDGIPSDYVNQVYSRISRHTNYPRAAKMRREEGRVAYKLTLNPQGELLKYEIQTSGSETLDDAAVDAIKSAAPFPKLPDLGGSSYLLAGAIVFKVN